jgi:xanthine/uracil permease
MAVLVGLVVGVAAGFWRGNLRFAVVVFVPLVVAAVEIIVNTARFGAQTIVVWAPILLILTVAATATALACGRWLSRRFVHEET